MPSLTITCDGCGESVTFSGLATLIKRSGFCDDTCAARHTRRSFRAESGARRGGSWNRIDGSRTAVRGPRADLGPASFRSAMEANVARFFNLTGIEWEFEPHMFVFKGEEYAPVNYRPDFRVVDRGRCWWVEVKGRWTGHDRQKLRKLKRLHPDDFAEMWVITKWSRGKYGVEEQRLLRRISPTIRITEYSQLTTLKHVLPGWEGK